MAHRIDGIARPFGMAVPLIGGAVYLIVLIGAGGPWAGLVSATVLTAIAAFSTFWVVFGSAVLSVGAALLLGEVVAGYCSLAALPAILALAIYRSAADRARRDAAAAARACAEWEEKLRHDLRSPLNGMLGALQLLERCQLDDRAQKYVGLGLKSVTNMTKLIDEGALDNDNDNARLTKRPMDFTRRLNVAKESDGRIFAETLSVLPK